MAEHKHEISCRVKTDIMANGEILQETYLDGALNTARESLCLRVMQTQDAAVRAALIKMGWTPPPD